MAIKFDVSYPIKQNKIKICLLSSIIKNSCQICGVYAQNIFIHNFQYLNYKHDILARFGKINIMLNASRDLNIKITKVGR